MWEITKWAHALRRSGLTRTLQDWWLYGEIKVGKLVGVDQRGNKYYLNDQEHTWGRDRWVDYASRWSYPRDASHIPPEWHAWMHRMTDIPPSSAKAGDYYANRPAWVTADHQENWTGTDNAYRPYSTTKPKIEQWQPGKAK